MAVLKVNNSEIVKNAASSAKTCADNAFQKIYDTGLKSDTTSFTGAVPNAKQTVEIMNGVTPNILNRMCSLKDNINEFQNIMINSVGTGLIAPIFIKWNPLSKTDEDTRTYTAMRQPVSAVLAIGTQAAITLPFAHAIKNMATDGMLGKLYNETPYSNPQSFLNNLRNKNKILYNMKTVRGTQRVEEMDAKSLETLINHTFDDMISTENIAVKNIEANVNSQIKSGKYLSCNSQKAMVYFKNMQTDLEKIKTSKEARAYFNDKIKFLKSRNADIELIELTENLRDMAAYSPKTKPSIIDRLLRRNPKLENPTEGNKVVMDLINKELDELTSQSGLINRFSGKTEQEIEQIVRNSVKAELNESNQAISILNDLKIRFGKEKLSVKDIENEIKSRLGKNSRFNDKEFAKEVMETLKKYTKNNISIFKQVSGMGVSLAMLPVTCALLNWVYPRFMDLCFPELSRKNKSGKGGDK